MQPDDSTLRKKSKLKTDALFQGYRGPNIAAEKGWRKAVPLPGPSHCGRYAVPRRCQLPVRTVVTNTNSSADLAKL
jgi:hypothetical protein